MKAQFMKLRQIGMGILLCLISIPCVQAQTYKKLWKSGGASRREKFARNCGKADGCNLSEGRERKEFSTNAKSLYVAG